MKRVHNHAILAFCVVLLCTLAAIPASAQQDAGEMSAEPQPKAVVDKPIFDAERVDVGDVIVHDFMVRNEGDAPLHVTDVRPTCGCTVADYDKVIAPGETGKVHAELDTTGEQGGISKGITVLTDDPENPHLVLTIKALIKPLIFANPGFARFIQPQLSDPGTVGQLVYSDSVENLELLSAESPYSFLAASVRPAREDELSEEGTGRQWVVEMTLDYTKAPIGAIADYVTVKTNHPKQPVLEIPVSGYVRPMIVATPHDVDFGDIEIPDDGLTTYIVVKNYGTEVMEVSDTTSTIPGVTVDVEPVRPGHEFNLLVTLPPELPKGEFSGKIELQLDHPRKKTLEIPLHGSRI